MPRHLWVLALNFAFVKVQKTNIFSKQYICSLVYSLLKSQLEFSYKYISFPCHATITSSCGKLHLIVKSQQGIGKGRPIA